MSRFVPRNVGTRADRDLYLYTYRGWSPDSRHVHAVIDGTDDDTLRRTPESGVVMVAFREIRTIDAFDGRAERVRRCEQPAPQFGSPRSEGTACDDSVAFTVSTAR